jgi:L-threonylcarbamoyladenylate synthase
VSASSNRIAAPTSDAIARAARALRAGELVAFPTETVYGLGADAGNPEAVRRMFAVKRRPASHPVIVHLHEAAAIDRWASDVPAGARALASAFWPGPLTLIVPRASNVSDVVTGGQDSVGLRIPSHPVARELLHAFVRAGGEGIVAPSANRFGHVSPTTAQHVADDLGDDVALILDGGASAIGIESTIVAFVHGRAVLLRPGAIGLDALAGVLGEPPRSADADAPRASGTLEAHYATRTRAFLVPPAMMRAEIAQREERDERVAVLARTLDATPEFDGPWLRAPEDASRYAHDLYANLRKLDAALVDAILIESVPDDARWMAVRDRLVRATHPGAEDDRD